MVSHIHIMATEMGTNEMGTNEIDVNDYIEEPHTIIDSCFRGMHLKRLVEHQVESYNDLFNIKFLERLLCLIQFMFVQSKI